MLLMVFLKFIHPNRDLERGIHTQMKENKNLFCGRKTQNQNSYPKAEHLTF